MAPHLPQELIDSIVDNLHDDKGALASASIISTAWLPPCRYHLFHSIRMKRGLDQGYDDFVDFLECTPVISGYIKQLHLKGQFRTTILVRLLGSLSRLTSLKIQGTFLSAEPVVIPFPPLKLDFLLVELIYSRNYPPRPVAEIRDGGEEAGGDGEDSSEGDEEDSSEEDEEDSSEEDEEDSSEEDGENHGDNSGEEDANSQVDDSKEEDREAVREQYDSEEESEVESNEGADEDMGGGAEEEDNQQPDGNLGRNATDADFDEVERLVSVLRLFSQVRELIVAYHSEHQPWFLEPKQLLTLVPVGDALEVDTFRFYHDEPNDSVITFFQRFLRMPTLHTFMFKSHFYLEGEVFLNFLLGAPSLVDLTVPANGFAYDSAITLGLPKCSTLRSLNLAASFSYGDPSSGDDPDDIDSLSDSDGHWRAFLDWDYLKAILETRVSQLHHLSITIEDGSILPRHLIQALGDIEWPLLENCIVDHYPRLETFTFLYGVKKNNGGRLVAEDVAKYIQERLPRLHAAGKLRLQEPHVPFKQIPPWQYDQDTDEDSD